MIPAQTLRSVESSPVAASASFGISQADFLRNLPIEYRALICVGPGAADAQTVQGPQPQTELLLGPFHCVGCIVEDGIKKWGPLGCPVHTPSQSHPIRDALETLARESATRKAMGEVLYGVKGHTP